MHISAKRIDEILREAAGRHIVVLGDIMIDQYLTGRVERISPEAPVPIVEIKEETVRLGGAANVALNVLSLGCAVTLVGLIGEDRMGHTCEELFAKRGIHAQGLVRSASRPTTVKTRVIGDNQHLVRVDKEVTTAADAAESAALQKALAGCLQKADALIMEDYNKGVLTPEIIKFAIKEAAKHGVPVMVDPKFNSFMDYRHVTVFKPNIIETAQALAVELPNENEAVEKAGRALLSKLEADSVLITRGARGLSLFEKDGTMLHIPTRARQVADVSGAGDTVIATFTVAVCGKADKKEAALLANMAAGLVVGRIGIVPVSAGQLRDLS
ncbi:MAG TPA: D-glycero-beta-D-manno-heptose-7-phosphate kinase [Caldithrix abyssi]|uniref:D-glycero-beta-D-manno-heptose-7-phosphate kinase n=1 Tax=Caldithrix abyssi TaxID=187145 RepID=A0A7V5RQT3_CALAY|nr:D-glycero-beta-D-manno-heptose-7-phosphate kinase [Caldithrix abyssi]